MTTTILPTRNEAWGYWGTISRNDAAANPTAAWEIASRRIAEATEAAPEGVRDFLDSRLGRPFADEVASGLGKGEALEPASRPRSPAGWAGGSTAAPSARTASRAGFPT
jgi:hypothetical protein